MKHSGQSSKKVSVIVPNFNHAEFLQRRLESIDAQTYENLEVILLDDCSTDGSVRILEEYHRKHPENSKLISNEVNSGSAFRQWKRGVEHCTGDLIWIAESDDYCEAQFLERLAREFEDDAVGIAYTAPKYVDSEGKTTEWCFEKYTAELSPGRWNHSYKVSGEDEVLHAMGIRNTMVNASALIVRRSAIVEHLMDGDWLEMSLCGDWLLYLKILRNHSVSFIKEAGAYYVQSRDSLGYLSARGEKYSREHQMILSYMEYAFPSMPNEVIDANIRCMLDHWMAVSNASIPDHVKRARYIRYMEHENLRQHASVLQNQLDSVLTKNNDITKAHALLIRSHDECLGRLQDLEKSYESIISSRAWRWTKPLRFAWDSIGELIK
jgi:glycosyltransferase involved in cell wall biosynthesis